MSPPEKKKFFSPQALFPATVFSGSFLLFGVQPMIAKYLLPFYGGSTSVWLVASLFFMTVLLLGYAYAHVLFSLSRKTMIAVHFFLLSAGVSLLISHFLSWGSPLLAAPHSFAFFSSPGFSIFITLLACVGIPYFILSSTSTVLQVLYERKNGKEPFWLYAVSNAASLLAVFSYPFLVEPFFSLRTQSVLWSFLYGAYSLLMATSLFLLARGDLKRADVREWPKNASILSWVWFGTLGSALLLVVTTYATRMIAPIPFLWLFPLLLYLLSFVITFNGNGWYRRGVCAPLAVFFLFVAAVAVAFSLLVPVFFMLFVLHTALFFSAVFCHGELYERRPGASHLTLFYLAVSFGGLLGGVLITVAAPLVFSGYFEFHIIFALTLLSALYLITPRKKQFLLIAALFSVFAAVSAYALRFGEAKMIRNFYGVTTIYSENSAGGRIRVMADGATVHGAQFIDASRENEPLAYYGKESGAGIVLSRYREWKKKSADSPVNVGIIGLGAGALASYGAERDAYRFYEINPAVISSAQKYFSYLSRSRSEIAVSEGDARLLLQEELRSFGPRGFDILILDAFADDSVPVHLLSREAFGLYLSHLSEGGILAVHISSRYLGLAPVIAASAETYVMQGAVVSAQASGPGSFASVWVILSRDGSFVRKLSESVPYAKALPEEKTYWTDEYSNLFSVVRW